MRRFTAAATVCLAWLGMSWTAMVSAATLTAVSPQGEVAQVRQISVKFSDAVVPFGDLRLPDPMSVNCQGAVPTGSGRWANDRVWLYDFAQAVPPGTRCVLKLKADWKPLTPLTPVTGGAREYSFNTGGPVVTRIEPSEGSQLAEDQFFALRLNGPAVESTVLANAWCEVEGIGERIAVRVVAGDERAQWLKARRLDGVKDQAQADLVLLLACKRPLPFGAAARLVWGKGIGAAVNPKITTSTEQRFRYTVRPAFTAEFSCERERANAACLPIRAMRIAFSAPVPREWAAKVTLKTAAGSTLSPVFEKDDKATEVNGLIFPVPLPENSSFSVEMPSGLKDNAGRSLANAASFPLKVSTADAPPIAKFAAAPFGVIELSDPLLPVTLRHVQADLRPVQGDLRSRASGGQVRLKKLQTDADILRWYRRVARYHEGQISAKAHGLPEKDWFTVQTETNAKGKTVQRKNERYLPTRELSLLTPDKDAKRLDLPKLSGGDPRPFEVVGIPLAEPGYFVVEIESQRLGESLLDKKAPMFVRTGVLVTNLGVHFKHGRENSLVWVTSLDQGKPVAGADVAVNNCNGTLLWAGKTDAQGLAKIDKVLDAAAERCGSGNGDRVDVEGASDKDADNNTDSSGGFFVTARKANAKAVIDTSFVFSSWQKGIEPWRFNVPTANTNTNSNTNASRADVRAATVFDRTLFRAGETVAMKHFVRNEVSTGLSLLKVADLPTRMKLVHLGSGQEFVQTLNWNGVRSAASTWEIPPAAKLGVYEVMLERESTNASVQQQWSSGTFRVEEFRLPLVDARLSGPKVVPAAPKELALAVQLNYFSGGAMAMAPARASALLKGRYVSFSGYDEFSFDAPREPSKTSDVDEEESETSASRRNGKLIADKLALTTDKNGAATFTLKDFGAVTQPSEVTAEVTFNDPNGEVQTVSTRVALWPSAVVLGMKTGSWASNRGKVKFTALALDTSGKALKGQSIEVRGRLSQVISTRKRMVGGFYAYDNRTETRDLGALCSGSTDDRGLLLCAAELKDAGQVELIATSKDAANNAVQAASSVWVTKQGELWFAQDNDDRMDVLPEKKAYEPGDTAQLQVRMPFREATALVAVEREGVIDTRVVTLRGDDPTVSLKIEKTWGPNVYVSVLALRGRMREVPWYSLFTWGWREPVNWARSFWFEGREYQAPTAMVDLAKPAFKLGVAALKVGTKAHELNVTVTADQPQYSVRQTAKARIKVLFEGKPLAGTEVAFAAVDEGLLALSGNASWDLLSAMLQQRAWGVETSTAQSEIVGRRHYGRKAVAAGGGGGRGATRELFDTLLLWKASVLLDANGEAQIDVPLNDSLTSFKLVAIADDGAQKFGNGSTSIRVTQDLQILSGLPPLVREGDQFSAMLTLRNTTAREMKVRANLQGVVNATAGSVAGLVSGAELLRTPLSLPPQEVVLAAGAATELVWRIDVPMDAISVTWEASVQEQGATSEAVKNAAKDRIKFTQLVSSAVPVRVMQASLQQLEGSFTLPVAVPLDALPDIGTKRGGLVLAVQPQLSGALPGMRRYFETYPFVCLEQKTSKAVGLKDAKLWAQVANSLPTYLDSDGLASYFPPRSEDGPRGSDKLTAYVLAATHEAGFELPAPARDAMLAGLAAFVEGRIERKFWSPKADLDVRKLAAIEALSRYGRAQPKMLGSLNLTPNVWPTAAVIDWLRILKKLDNVQNQSKRLEEAQQILRSRLTYAGTTLKFSNEEDDFWWWLMDSADANAARLMLAVMDDPAWKDDLPRMVVGSLGRQKSGAWLTTTANLWGSLALDKFSAKFESVKLSGKTLATLGDKTGVVDWARTPRGSGMTLAWPAEAAQAAPLTVTQEGSGKPWLTVQSLAAVALKRPINAGYRLTRSLMAVEQKDKSKWSRGDVVRVRLEIDAQSDMTWVVVSDPVPGGATILGSGLGRDSAIATGGEKRSSNAWPVYEERSFEAFRSYFDYLPRGKHTVEYTVRLNNPGRFALPPSRVEAMYAPESFGELPNAAIEVAP